MQQETAKTSNHSASAAAAMSACAAVSFILNLTTLSHVLGVLLLVGILCGVLISLALARRTPQKERS